MTIEYDSKWPGIDLFPDAPPFSSHELLSLKQDQTLSWVLDFFPTLLSNVKMRIYFVLLLE